MFDDLKFASKDEDEMEDFRDYGDDSDDVDSKLDEYEDDEDDEEDEDRRACTRRPFRQATEILAC